MWVYKTGLIKNLTRSYWKVREKLVRKRGREDGGRFVEEGGGSKVVYLVSCTGQRASITQVFWSEINLLSVLIMPAVVLLEILDSSSRGGELNRVDVWRNRVMYGASAKKRRE